ncbi:hypothetical protein OSB04_022996 [Centaurea solstitialis]|uniref:Uncharacterized protein n=1 Tax=Centaurea solstitialis TaxID=347529 RepID=A0AA38WAL7_9ASTR|nr:hypothetical protein OSB04_022996 [Centaurea solstitialis]
MQILVPLFSDPTTYLSFDLCPTAKKPTLEYWFSSMFKKYSFCFTSESSHSSRPARSSSAARPSISTTQYTNRNSNILNTSSTSVSSYIKPSAISNRSSSAARPTSRATTPSRTRPSSTTTSINRTIKPSQNSRPSTPTRRTPTPSLLPSSPSGGRAALPSNGRISRPSSPVSHVRPPPQPPIIILHDFQHKRPPNLSTTLPERPLSAGRSRPGAAMTVKGHVQNTNSGTITKRPSSPIVNRGRGRPHTNGNVVEMLEPRKTSHLPIKMSNTENGMGFGRSISKKSLDMAIKHMVLIPFSSLILILLSNGATTAIYANLFMIPEPALCSISKKFLSCVGYKNGGIRPLSSSTLFPQSIRTGNSKMQRGRAPSGSVRNEVVAPQHNRASYSSKVAEMDMYESSRYDAMLLKEDLNNTSWLHSISTDDENSDQGPVFDNGFEPPPEPFGPL